MNFAECIDKAVKAGKLKAKKGEQAKVAFEEALEEAKAEGLTGGSAYDYATRKAVERISKGSAARQWERVKEIRMAAEFVDRFSATSTPDHELWMLGNQLEISQIGLTRQAFAYAGETIAALRPRAAGLIRPTQKANNLVRVLHGEKVSDPGAEELTRGLVEADKYLNTRANMEGASVPDNPQGKPSLQHDRMRLRKRARKLGSKKAQQEWVNDQMRTIDWELVREPDGTEISLKNRYIRLNQRYNAIMSKGNSLIRADLTGEESVAGRLSREEFFYYKDADSYLEMLDKYGTGSAWTQLISNLVVKARDVATLKHLGPHPASALDYVGKAAGKRAYEVDKALDKPARRSTVDKVDTHFSILKDRYRIHAHEVNNGAESIPAQVVSTTRTGVMSAILSGAYISNIGDIGFAYNTAMVNHIPAVGYLGKVLKDFGAMPSGQRAAAAASNGFGMDSVVDSALTQQRYLGPLDGPAFVRRMSDSMFRATWMTPWTQATRWAWHRTLVEALGENAGKAFDELSFVDSMKRFGITEEDWNLFRKTPLRGENNGTQLYPIDMLKRTDVDERTRARVSDKFFDWMIELERDAVPTAGTRELAALGGAQDRSRLTGQALAVFSAVKTFPTVIMTRYLHEIMQQPTIGGKLGHIARFFTVLTIAGAFITQMKEIAIRGRDPIDMTTPEFWAQAALNGGSLGFLGDAVFNNVNQYRGGGLSEVFAGPIVDFANDFRNLTIGNVIEAFEKQDTKLWRESVEFGARYTPIPWQTKLLVQRAIITDLLMLVDPLAYRRLHQQERRRLTERGQSTWWGITDPLPARGPDLSAAIGGSRR